MTDGEERATRTPSVASGVPGQRRRDPAADRFGPEAEASPPSGVESASDDSFAQQVPELDSLLIAGLLEAEPSYLFFKDLQGRYLRVSRPMAYALGLDEPDDVIGKRLQDLVPGSEADQRASDDMSVVRTGVPIIELQERMFTPGDEHRWVVSSRYPIRDAEGRIVATMGIMRDVTVRKLMEERLEQHSARLGETNAELVRVQQELREILQTSPDPTVRFDEQLRVRFANPAGLTLLGHEEHDVIGATLEELGRPAGIDAAALSRCLVEGQDVEYETRVRLSDGRMSYLHARLVPEFGPEPPGDRRGMPREVCGVLLVGRDLTDRKRAEDLLADRAVRDPLTGLANRVLLTDRLEQTLLRLDRQQGTVAVLFLDLDQFKQVNGRLGHRAGDAVLTEVAARLARVVGRRGTVSRVGGDEFVVLCERVADAADAGMLADRLGRALGKPIVRDGEPVVVTASIGIRLLGPSEGMGEEPLTADSVLRDAGDAMDQAKKRGGRRGSYVVYDPRVREQLAARRSVETQLREALQAGQFQLAYQPLVSLTDRRLVGTEALLRWHHPERGMVAPGDFIPIAEDSGQIVAIGSWVLDEAVRQLAEWNRRREGPPLTMAVNLSARQLAHPGLVEEVRVVLARHRVPASQLCLEVTETALLEEGLSTIEVFRRLSELGVRLALDDFGTGYSSLVHLRRFPVDVLKIDRQFVNGLDGGSGDDAIVAAVTAMAHALGMVTVAEGIETPEQLAELVRLGCDEGQGFLLARPLPPTVLEADALFVGPDGSDSTGSAGGGL